MPILKIKLHQSLRIKGEPHEFSESFNSGTIVNNMRKLLSNQPAILDLCLSHKGRKPGILYLSEKTELASLGLLESELNEDLEIRIVPILHGG
ncbi:MAG: hypothetical protein GPJ54_02810 [Candidatus Heimdallarchaeota archaeon]|nr:hypothetical protein [Candidatus Heimdallarchaeota archaeon]